MKTPRVALVVMPFASTKYPSIQCGLLKAVLAERGIACDVHYFNLEMARRIGPDLYECLAHISVFLGEWPFARALDGETPEARAFADKKLELIEGQGFDRARYEPAAAAAESLLDHAAEAVDWSRYTLIGFSSVFFTQFSTAALAKRIKERAPGAKLVVGGPNVEGEMGRQVLAAFPWLDYVVDGEGEEALLALARGQAPPAPASIKGGKADLARLPIPDYDDYFEALERSGLKGQVDVTLWFEGSRGCWWGEKKHCTFCGLNGESMAYRVKPAERVLAELDHLSRRHGVCTFSATDSIIDHHAHEELLPLLARKLEDERLDLNIFFETKANLNRERVRLMKSAGVRRVQPGIESLDSGLLEHMRKGVTMLQNVAALRALREFDVDATWLFLYGFPGERPESYARMLDLLPWLTHLQAPQEFQPVGLVRYSPYFFEGEKWGVENLGARPEYRILYGKRCDPEKVAYDFEMGLPGRPDLESYVAPLRAFCRRWKSELAASTFLHVERGPEHVMVYDRRLAGPAERAPRFRRLTLRGLDAKVLSAAVDLQGLGELAARLGAPRADVEAACARLAAERLMLVEDGRALSLPLPIPGNPRALHERAQKLETFERLELSRV